MHAKNSEQPLDDACDEDAEDLSADEEQDVGEIDDQEWEKAWGEECGRRWAEYEAGLVELIPEEQVFAEVYAELAKP